MEYVVHAWNNSCMKSDSQAQYVAHAWNNSSCLIEKQFQKWNTLCAWNNSTSLKTILKWDILVCLKQLFHRVEFSEKQFSNFGNTLCAWIQEQFIE